MIVKFNRRGSGRGEGVTQYLLGRNGDREGATLLRGNPAITTALMNQSPFAKKYTSGVLSFAEGDEPDQTARDRIMDTFEHTLLTGLERNQYDILWVEHRDKGRLELNFVIPNIELQTGKRLQPYYDPADRRRVNAWAILVREQFGLADPNEPERRRALTLPRDLPKDKAAAAQQITDHLVELVAAGVIENRAMLVAALEESGFEVTRTVKNSISIKADNGQPIRLKGGIYEQDFRRDSFTGESEAAASQRYAGLRETRIRAAQADFAEGIARKRDFFSCRYAKSDRLDAAGDREIEEYCWSFGIAPLGVPARNRRIPVPESQYAPVVHRAAGHGQPTPDGSPEGRNAQDRRVGRGNEPHERWGIPDIAEGSNRDDRLEGGRGAGSRAPEPIESEEEDRDDYDFGL